MLVLATLLASCWSYTVHVVFDNAMTIDTHSTIGLGVKKPEEPDAGPTLAPTDYL